MPGHNSYLEHFPSSSWLFIFDGMAELSGAIQTPRQLSWIYAYYHVEG
jgi:hypothetical protein